MWSSTRYDSPELTRFARRKAVAEARKGLAAMSILTMGILLIEATLYFKFALDPMYLYTCAILLMLSLNMVFASRTVGDPQAFYLPGVTPLAVSGSALIPGTGQGRGYFLETAIVPITASICQLAIYQLYIINRIP